MANTLKGGTRFDRLNEKAIEALATEFIEAPNRDPDRAVELRLATRGKLKAALDATSGTSKAKEAWMDAHITDLLRTMETNLQLGTLTDDNANWPVLMTILVNPTYAEMFGSSPLRGFITTRVIEDGKFLARNIQTAVEYGYVAENSDNLPAALTRVCAR